MIGNKNIPITETYQPNGLKYLALGDSYTIGEGEKAEYTYPFQVEEMLEKEGFGFSTIKVIAKTGWTSSELINAVRQENIGQASFDIASLLIGVNNQYQGQTLDQFKKELIELIELTGKVFAVLLTTEIASLLELMIAGGSDHQFVSGA